MNTIIEKYIIPDLSNVITEWLDPLEILKEDYLNKLKQHFIKSKDRRAFEMYFETKYLGNIYFMVVKENDEADFYFMFRENTFLINYNIMDEIIIFLENILKKQVSIQGEFRNNDGNPFYRIYIDFK